MEIISAYRATSALRKLATAIMRATITKKAAPVETFVIKIPPRNVAPAIINSENTVLESISFDLIIRT
jgi:hypothetical protein